MKFLPLVIICIVSMYISPTVQPHIRYPVHKIVVFRIKAQLFDTIAIINVNYSFSRLMRNVDQALILMLLLFKGKSILLCLLLGSDASVWLLLLSSLLFSGIQCNHCVTGYVGQPLDNGQCYKKLTIINAVSNFSLLANHTAYPLLWARIIFTQMLMCTLLLLLWKAL